LGTVLHLTLPLFSTASTIVAFIIHSKFDYSNSVFCSLPKNEISNKLIQKIQNPLACAAVKAPKFLSCMLALLSW